ncbi:MAG: TIGR03905 family TSCPD domain-containing protein [Ruminococcaceae bacterium]|nr:TIGR03905 family TSCPD domain-containing protein [Oscillospiraceae bacterium]MBE6707010.1 TIGR03905 family TSCPD domain-containing protein [Oscillospiraceae bacterium]
MEKITYTPNGVCSRRMEIEVEDGKITAVKIVGGCAGNTQGVSRLLVGMDVDEAIERLSGIRCGFKPTSCPDQLAKALGEYKAKQ